MSDAPREPAEPAESAEPAAPTPAVAAAEPGGAAGPAASVAPAAAAVPAPSAAAEPGGPAEPAASAAPTPAVAAAAEPGGTAEPDTSAAPTPAPSAAAEPGGAAEPAASAAPTPAAAAAEPGRPAEPNASAALVTPGDAEAGAPPSRTRRQTFTRWAPLITAVIALATIAADQLSKLWAEQSLSTERVQVLGDLLGFQLIYNPGAAFSIGEQYTWIFAVLAGLAAIAVGVIAYRTRSLAWAVAWGLLLGGAITHLGDRLFREPGFGIGHVFDFIAYGNWFIGNLADVAIFAGAVLILILSFLGFRMRPTPAPAA